MRAVWTLPFIHNSRFHFLALRLRVPVDWALKSCTKMTRGETFDLGALKSMWSYAERDRQREREKIEREKMEREKMEREERIEREKMEREDREREDGEREDR